IVAGFVIDADSGQPIVGAAVDLSTGQKVLMTDGDGSFQVYAPAGRVRMTVHPEGYLAAGREVVVAGATVPVLIRMVHRAAFQRVNAGGGVVRSGQALIEVPQGTYP